MKLSRFRCLLDLLNYSTDFNTVSGIDAVCSLSSFEKIFSKRDKVR